MSKWILFAIVILAAVTVGHMYLAAIDAGCDVQGFKVTC
jgi:hypothetical protein